MLLHAWHPACYWYGIIAFPAFILTTTYGAVLGFEGFEFVAYMARAPGFKYPKLFQIAMLFIRYRVEPHLAGTLMAGLSGDSSSRSISRFSIRSFFCHNS
jgi:hypothetical protein